MIPGGFNEGDPVVLPSGKHASVMGELLGRVQCRYLHAPAGERTVVLQPHLLRKIVNGIVPPPVRISRINGVRR